MIIKCIIPAQNEEATIGAVVSNLLKAKTNDLSFSEIIVVDNASNDNTRFKAEEAGARVEFEEEKGYGAACLKGIEKLGETDIVVFVDGDGSDKVSEWLYLVDEVIHNDVDMVIGSRLLKNKSEKKLPFHQAFGNKLSSFLLGIMYKQRFTDLGPFRAIKAKVLYDLDMQDRDFGWTVEMQIKALRKGYKVSEIPVTYYDRLAGESKVSGTLRGSFLAGKKILTLIFRDIISSSSK